MRALAVGFLFLATLFPCRPIRAASLDYVVSVDDLSQGVIHVTVTVDGVPTNPLRIRAVPTYVDNPTSSARHGTAVVNFMAADQLGGALPVTSSSTPRGETVFEVISETQPLQFSYSVNVDFVDSDQTTKYAVLIPYMDTERAWLYGNHVFCYPELSRRMVESVGTPIDISLEFELADDIALVGLPRETVRLQNLYELMSLQFGMGEFFTRNGQAGDISYSVILRDSLEFSAAERDTLASITHRLISYEVDFFDGAPFETLGMFYFRREGIGGLEGSNVCQSYILPGIDVTDTDNANVRAFFSVALHEVFHTWNPVYMLSLDDPWIKEGVSTYYHIVLGSRTGISGDAEIEREIEIYGRQVDGNPQFATVTLSDTLLWESEYDGEEWRTLTYERGKIVALLLDIRIRELTGNVKSLDDVMRGLFRRFRHVGYTRENLIDTILDDTGFDASAFFAEYVDGTRVATLEEVRVAFETARELGVFDRR